MVAVSAIMLKDNIEDIPKYTGWAVINRGSSPWCRKEGQEEQ